MLDQHAQCIAGRDRAIANIIDTVTSLNWDLESLELRLEKCRVRFNRCQAAGGQKLYLQWICKRRASLEVNYQAALWPVTYKPGRDKKVIPRSAWFRQRELERHTFSAHLDERQSVYAEIKILYKLLYGQVAVLQDGVSIARTAPVVPDIELNYTSSNWKFTTACAHRELNSRYVINTVQALGIALRRNDAALTEAMRAFNGIEPRKRNGSLSVSIQLRGTQKEQRLGPGYPVFSTISFLAGKRILRPVKAGASGRANRITRDVLRSRYLVRYSIPFHRYAREIEHLRNQRRQLRASLEAFYKCFKPELGEDS